MSVAAGRFLGQSVKRKEDRRLLTGHGSFVDDVVVPGMLHGAFLRSDMARAKISAINVEEAKRLTGVHAVLTAEDLNSTLRGTMVPTMFADGAQGPSAPVRPLADRDVRFVGEPIAIVVADSRYIAEDACDLIQVDYEAMSPVVDYEVAAEDTENLVHPELGSNLATPMAHGPTKDFDEALATAAHVVTRTFYQHRHTNVPMETRGVVAHWDRYTDRLRVWISSQNPHEVRLCCSRIL